MKIYPIDKHTFFTKTVTATGEKLWIKITTEDEYNIIDEENILNIDSGISYEIINPKDFMWNGRRVYLEENENVIMENYN